MKTVLITGGNGFIAGHTIEAALKRGYKVITNVRGDSYPAASASSTYLLHTDVTLYHTDSRDKVAMRSLIEQVDGVINLAGILGTKHVDNARDFYENNVFSALNVFDACSEFGVPVVQIAVGNHFETNNYSNSKTAAERDLLMYTRFKGLKGNIVRGLNVIGPRQKVRNTGKIAPTFITKALTGEPLQVYGGKDNCGIMDCLYVKDIANILLDVLEKDTYGNIYEAGTGVGIPVWEIAEAVVRLTGSKSEIQEVPMRAGESNRSVVVAKDPYPYNYTPFEEVLKETIKYYKDEPNRD